MRDFIDTEVIPCECSRIEFDVAVLDGVLPNLRARARQLGIFAPQLPREYGGLALSWTELSVLLEEAGRSFLGPSAINCGAPDQPNMISLLQQGTKEQQQRYLVPLASGSIRSCFAMTEAAPGAGSDPSMLKTEAVRRRGGWIIDGHKWFISGAVNAQFAIVLAQTSEGATQFIVDATNPGFRVARNIGSINGYQVGGHGEIMLAQCQVDDDAVLGEVGRGFQYAQARLEPARLSHCMRFIGRASRAIEIAQDYVAQRTSFGRPLADLQQVQAMVADSHIELHAARLMTWHCAALLDAGQSVKHESSMTKVYVSEVVNRVADRAAQMMGALGMSDDTPVAAILRELRPFRIYDGASELHRATLARQIFKAKRRPSSKLI